jgi:alkaline phosphatase D
MTTRRLFLIYTASLAGIPHLGRGESPKKAPAFQKNPFSLGVASGDPDHQSVVLWTRLAPDPLVPRGGMPDHPVEVKWEIADDEKFTTIVAGGTTPARPQLGHSVHVTPTGLESDRWFFYRFKIGKHVSATGRTRTLPQPDAEVDSLKIAVTSCQNFEQGHFTAYEQMRADAPDLVFHLGDYIYEYAANRSGKVRTHLGPEIESLDDYRIRYAQYRLDPLLANMHAACPWFVTWDDHEVDNNYANDISEQKGIAVTDLLRRRAHAYQAYYEMMPLRESSLPQGPRMDLYRKASFGKLAQFHILDTRQYRTDQPNDDGRDPLNEAARNPNNSLLGKAQREWLFQGLQKSPATWNVLAQQVMMGMHAHHGKNDEEAKFSMDAWTGYLHEREELLKFIKESKVANPIVLTGDVHTNWINELRLDDHRPEQAVLATEFVTTSLSSSGNGSDAWRSINDFKSANPCVKFHNNRRGYIRCTLTPDHFLSDYMITDQVTKPGGTTANLASFVVENGTPGIL